MLSILTSSRRNYSMARYVRRCLWCIVAAVGLYCVAPVTEWHSGRIVMNFMGGRMFDYMLLLKCSFAVVVSLLYSRIYVLISQRQAVVVENERLKNENLTTRYNLLVGQINPPISSSTRSTRWRCSCASGRTTRRSFTSTRLSYTFRYIIQNGQSTLMTLGEELKFAEAYSYLFKIRYADKLFFDIAVDARYFDWRLPALSLQPLIGNAVKHNTITRSNPLHVSIRVENGILEVSNPPASQSSNPSPRPVSDWRTCATAGRLITGRDIAILSTEERFTVRLPLLNPDKAMMKALLIEDETAAARNLAAVLREVAPACRSWRRSKASPRASNGCVPIPSPTCCSWTSTWRTAIPSASSAPWRSPLRSSSPRPTTAMRSRRSRSAASTTCSNRSMPTTCGVRWRRLRRLTSGERLDYGSRVRSLAAQRRKRSFWSACATGSFPTARPDRLLLHFEREGHGLRFRRGDLPARQDPRSVAGLASRARFLPRQPAVHRGAPRREGDSRVVRQPSDAPSYGRYPRADRHFQSPRSRIQDLAAGGSPCRIGGSARPFCRYARSPLRVFVLALPLYRRFPGTVFDNRECLTKIRKR